MHKFKVRNLKCNYMYKACQKLKKKVLGLAVCLHIPRAIKSDLGRFLINIWHFFLLFTCLLLTEFEGRTLSYRQTFFPINLYDPSTKHAGHKLNRKDKDQ